MSLSQKILNSKFYSQVDIVKKYNKYPQFKKQLDKLQLQYEHDLNMSIYSNLQHVQAYQVIQCVSKNKLYVNFYAFKMTFSEEQSHKMYMLFIRMLDQKLRQNIQKKYTIIYYHCFADSNYPYTFLKQAFKKLPIFYYAMLDKIYVVEPGFILKTTAGMLQFGRLFKLFSRRLQFVDNMYYLAKIDQIKNNNVLDSLPDILKNQKTLRQEKKAMKQNALGNISNQNKNIQTPNFEQSPPITLKSIQKKDFLTINLQKHKLTVDGLPIPLIILLQTLKQNPNFLEMQGIFRKSGSIQQEEDIISELQKMPTVAPLKNLENYSGFAIAGVVKKFFTKLLIPIVPYDTYNKIMSMSTVSQKEQISFVRKIIQQLPSLNKKVFIYLLVFLKQQVISRQEINKMNNYNMSVCFCPCIFRAQQASLQDLMNSGKYAKILNILFSKFQQIIDKEYLVNELSKENKQNRASKGSKSSGSRGSKQNRVSKPNEDSPTKIL